MSRLQEYRKNFGISQFELAKKCGCSIQSVQKYEQGVLKIESCHLDILTSMSDILGIKLSDLLENRDLARKIEEQYGAQLVQHAER